MPHERYPKLFSPIQVGPMALQHRVAMAPLTRSRSEAIGDVPGNLMLEYYSQRSSAGGLLVTEGTSISIAGRGWFGAPGIHTDEQVAGWTRITRAVHAKGAHVFLQLWHTGRTSHVDLRNGALPAGPSVIPSYWTTASPVVVSTPRGWLKPSPHRALDLNEIPAVLTDYRQAAMRAKAAGFDGVEIHAANGYLLDQFLQDGSNKRTDAYGGSVENRARLLLEVVETVTGVWSGDRVGVRIAPSGTWNAMSDSDPTALFAHVARELNRFGLAYLHVIEPRIAGSALVAEGQEPLAAAQLRRVFGGTIVSAGGFEPDTAEAVVVRGDADLVAFGRHFISNPDLPKRIRFGLPLIPYDRSTFYTFDFHGYTDYPAYEEEGDALTDPFCPQLSHAPLYLDSRRSAEGAREAASRQVEAKNKALVLEAFDTLFNRRDYAAAERYWSPDYIQHSSRIPPGRQGLFALVEAIPKTLRYEPGVVVADGDFVIAYGRFSGIGHRANEIAADVLRVEDGILVEHWDVTQDEASRAESKSGRSMFGESFPG